MIIGFFVLVFVGFFVIAIKFHNISSFLTEEQNSSVSSSCHCTPSSSRNSYWENFKNMNTSKAIEIEDLLNIDMSKLSDKDAREKIQMLERLSKNMGCSISHIKENYLKEVEKYPNHLIVKMIASTRKEIVTERENFHISEANTASSLIIEWLKEILTKTSKEEPFWDTWEKENPKKAQVLIELTKRDFSQMEDIDVKQIVGNFKRLAETNGILDWILLKDFIIHKFEEMEKDLDEEEAMNIFENQILEEAAFSKIEPSNTAIYYLKLLYKDFIKSKYMNPCTPEEYRKIYKSKLLKKIGSNANIPLFCEGYDSPIAHEIMNLMYQHMRDEELKAKVEKQDLWDKYMQIIIEETEHFIEKYCHVSLQECIEYYNFPEKPVITRSRCPSCGSRNIMDDSFDNSLECMECGRTWRAPIGIRLYL